MSAALSPDDGIRGHTHCDLRWDGRCLELALMAGTSGEIAIDLDGCHFALAVTEANGVARFELPFSPSGHAHIAVLPRLGRVGPPLLDGPVEICFGQPGRDTTAFTAKPLAPMAMAQHLLPAGSDALQRDVAVIVPVYDAPKLVARCLESVLRYSGAYVRVIVIDDASPDAAVQPLLERYANHPNVEVLSNASNLGFTTTVNRAMRLAAPADVVLLNADAEVGPNWLSGLRRAAYSQADIATVTAVSDNAGAFSVPELEQTNRMPAGWDLAATARALWQEAGLVYPSMPTGNGFCLYIRRAALDAVGLFDEAAFPQGYGEENDFCQRAQAVGFRDIIAGNVYVAHARSQSFGVARREALGLVGMRILRERWPNYDADVARDLHSFERRVLDWRVRRSFADANPQSPPKPRVLWLDDTQVATVKLVDFDVWRLTQDGDTLQLSHDAGESTVASAPFTAALHAALQMYAIELVVESGIPIAEVTMVAARLGIPALRVAGNGTGLAARMHATLVRNGSLR